MNEFEKMMLNMKKKNPNLQIVDMSDLYYDMAKEEHPQAPLKISYEEFINWIYRNYPQVYEQYKYDYYNTTFHLNDHGEFLDWLYARCFYMETFPQKVFHEINDYIERNS